MKSKIVVLIALLSVLQLSAQNVVNPSFDSVYIGGIDRMHSWITSDAWLATVNDTVLPMTPNTHFVSVGLQYHELLYTSTLEYSNAFDGLYAMNLISIAGRVRNDGIPFRGFVVNGDHFYTNNSGYIDFAKCGTPFPHRPSKLRGHYKFLNTSPSLTNFGKAIVLLKKYNSTLQKIDTIAYAETTTQLLASGWLPFELPLTYYSAAIPDSVVVVFESSALGLSSTLTVDSLGFYYPQPGGVNELNEEEAQPFSIDLQNQQLLFKKEFTFFSAEVFDLNGKKLKSILSSTRSIALFDLPKGIYLLQILENDKRIKSYKFNK